MEQPAQHQPSEAAQPAEQQQIGQPYAPDEQPLKLFVGQVPKHMDEAQLRPIFEKAGPIAHLMVIRDRQTRMHRGCMFITYQTRAAAEAAIEMFNNNVKLPNAQNPLQMRPADSHAGMASAVKENKLFVGMMPARWGEDELRQLFQPYGKITEIYVIRDLDGTSKGCAFVKYEELESANAAIKALHEAILEGGSRPLVVKLADKKQRQQPPSRLGGMGGGPPAWHQPALGVGYPYASLPPAGGGSMGASAYLPLGSTPPAPLAQSDVYQQGKPQGGAPPQYYYDSPQVTSYKGPDRGGYDYQLAQQQAQSMGYSYPSPLQIPQGVIYSPAPPPQQPIYGTPPQYGSAAASHYNGGGGGGHSSTSHQYGAPPPLHQHMQQQHLAAAAAQHVPQQRHHLPQSHARAPLPQQQPRHSSSGGGHQYAMPSAAAAYGRHGGGGYAAAAAPRGAYGGSSGGGRVGVEQALRDSEVAAANAAAAAAAVAVELGEVDPGVGDGGLDGSGHQAGPRGASVFVYHLPPTLTDADLATAFSPIGNVLSAKVFVDELTGESRGFGYVSYDDPAAADEAIQRMNGFQIGSKHLKVQHKREPSGQQQPPPYALQQRVPSHHYLPDGSGAADSAAGLSVSIAADGSVAAMSPAGVVSGGGGSALGTPTRHLGGGGGAADAALAASLEGLHLRQGARGSRSPPPQHRQQRRRQRIGGGGSGGSGDAAAAAERWQRRCARRGVRRRVMGRPILVVRGDGARGGQRRRRRQQRGGGGGGGSGLV
ncbi:hypothetical protein JKP88DRAFT_354504 [Tribonema minus]|uniref:RRM domain-containing protein n=1 Tax=Tribonema minus TaxID=303371 RepID=A0A836CFQ8_9STRA|nr:hypothetical protein JKP88DRAFT_354504 [Tribonema minus]